MNNHDKTLPALIMLTLLYVCITASGRDVTVRTPGTLHTTIKSNEKYRISNSKQCNKYENSSSFFSSLRR